MKLSGTFTVGCFSWCGSPFGSNEHQSAPHPETFQNSSVLPPKRVWRSTTIPFALTDFPKSHLPPPYFQKEEWFPELWQPDPSFPHCIVVKNMTSVGGDLPYHSWLEKILVPLEGEDAQKQNSVWWYFPRKRSNLHMLMCEWRAGTGCE